MIVKAGDVNLADGPGGSRLWMKSWREPMQIEDGGKGQTKFKDQALGHLHTKYQGDWEGTSKEDPQGESKGGGNGRAWYPRSHLFPGEQ